MSDLIKSKFRSSYGLDAAGEKVINVADADRTVLSDGVNVGFLIQENTVQQYDSARGYPAGFVIMYNGRIWRALETIAKPAGTFVESKWKPIRVDPKWNTVTNGRRTLEGGDYISVDTSIGSDIELTLPNTPTDGDTICIRDIGGRPGFVSVLIKASIQSIVARGLQVREIYLSIPHSELVFVFSNRIWNLYSVEQADRTKTVLAADIVNEVQAGELVLRQYNSQKLLSVNLPKYANNGDVIEFAGELAADTAPTYFHTELKTVDTGISIGTKGSTKLELKRKFTGRLIYDSTNALWRVYENDALTRPLFVTADTVIKQNQSVVVLGPNASTATTINLTLPTNIELGDYVDISLRYLRANNTVVIKPGTTGETILANDTVIQFPKRSQYPAATYVSSASLTFTTSGSYVPFMRLVYAEVDAKKTWVVVESTPTVERVDSTSDATRARVGVIALATQAQANIDKENSPNKEVAVTPETLANRVALETRRGIAKIATTAQVNQVSTATYVDDVIVTPKKLNERTATETRRGLAEIATQTETNAGTDDSTIITPKKLEARRATETMAGIAPVVKSGGVAPTTGSRDTAGTLIYDFADHSNIVTPKVLREFKSNELQPGIVYLATETEVIDGNAALAGYPVVVTPQTLHKKTATESRHGLTETATQAETNAGTDDFRYITPKKLAGRASTESMTGVARIATQTEFNAGTLDNVISTPLKIKTRFNSTDRTSVVAASGLVESGTLWDNYTLNILDASETQRGTLKLSTQAQTNAGTDDTTAVTPKKLHAKKATESVEGIIQVATAAETTAGTIANKAVSPKNLLNTIQVDTTWEATTTRRGTVKLTEGALTFVGNSTSGSTQSVDLYKKTGYAISPYELNLTLANFLPKNAKAVDSDKLDNLDSSQFVRRDIAQTVAGAITFSANTQMNAALTTTGLVTLGKSADGVAGAEKDRLVVYPSVQTANQWKHTVLDDASTSKYNIKYGTTNVLTLNSGGTLGVVNNLTVGGTLTQSGAATINNTLKVTGAVTVGTTQAIGSGTGTLTFSNTGVATTIQTSDANTLKVTDTAGTYDVLTTKNMNSKLDARYLNVAGDTMTGRLTATAGSTISLPAASAPITTVPGTSNLGTWSSEITSSTHYNALPGYVVGVPDVNAETGQPTGFIKEYTEVKGPGTLSQFGVTTNSTFQIWAPRPTGSTANHLAQTFYMRQYNPVSKVWDGWGRLYTSNNPPTASEIGAISDNGSSFASLRIKDWLQVGNVKISADPTTKTVRFDWID